MPPTADRKPRTFLSLVRCLQKILMDRPEGVRSSELPRLTATTEFYPSTPDEVAQAMIGLGNLYPTQVEVSSDDEFQPIVRWRWRRVVVESPFAGDVEGNLTYLRAAMADCLSRGEAPYASHGLYTQPGVLDDTKPTERSRGIAAGFAWGAQAEARVFYLDKGFSRGMIQALRLDDEIPVEYRSLPQFDTSAGRPGWYLGLEWQCPGCGALLNSNAGLSGAWRWTGLRASHKCPDVHPQCGHTDALPTGQPFDQAPPQPATES